MGAVASAVSKGSVRLVAAHTGTVAFAVSAASVLFAAPDTGAAASARAVGVLVAAVMVAIVGQGARRVYDGVT